MWGRDGVADNYPLHEFSEAAIFFDTKSIVKLVISAIIKIINGCE
jgi:hypothetical protein